MKSKKGISPLIATVLLIGIVVTIALLVWFWYGNVLKERAEKAGEEGELQFLCASKVDLSITNVCSENNVLFFDVENKGTIDINNFKIRVTGDSGSDTVNLDEKIDKTVSKQTSISHNNVGDIEKVEIFPILEKNGKSEVCSGKVVEVTPEPC